MKINFRISIGIPKANPFLKKKLPTHLCEEINAFNGCCKKCERIEKFLGVDTKDFPDGLVFLFDILIVDTKHLFSKENG